MLRIVLFLAFAAFNVWVLFVLIRFIFARLGELRDPEERRRAVREFALDELGQWLFFRFPGMGNPLQQIFVTLLIMAGILVADYFTILGLWPELLGRGSPAP